MKTNVFTPFKSLNPAYFRLPVVKQDVDDFEKHLNEFKSSIKSSESEEYNKNVFTQFLYNSFYNGKNKVNTKGRIDLAIYEDETPIVIFEFKKPKPNDSDMVSLTNLNAKSIHQLIKYYFDERIKHNNTNIKYLIITNAFEWFVFDERNFDQEIYCNTQLKKNYETCIRENKNEDYFYKIAKSFLEKEKPELKFTYFDLREQKERSKVRTLYKFFSPQHLLKQALVNDSNSLNKDFYHELLHIIGLEEVKDGSKKIIQRKKEEKRNEASLLENVIFKLKQKDRLSKLINPITFGETEDERYFHVGLELCINWINRILFLKLMESQLIRYHRGDQSYRFLNIKTVHDYDEMGNLFFSVLAKNKEEREKRVKEKFSYVPYLNSSLFEESDLEKDILSIENLDNNLELEIYKSTKLLDGYRPQQGKLNTLEYIFRFLDSYNFASEGTDEEQEDKKALINASVLGLMFEKLNGYKDGSFYTPGFITMYMCKETLRRAVVQKFKEKYKWKCETIEDIYNYLERETKKILEYNEVIDELKICDPAVGSGHFLVSALNELLTIKSELGILADKTGKVLPVSVRVANDELMIEENDERIFEYHVTIGKSVINENHRVQKTLFHEKEKLIEHCLFGVDINGNSVKICRLRLWIELLKNTYYTEKGELETLPNIDINIKRGNSLLSRFNLDSDLSSVFKQQKFNYSAYRNTVEAYKQAPNKKVKEDLLKFIKEIKEQFKTTFYNNDPLAKKKRDLLGQLALMDNNIDLFGTKIRDESFVEIEKKRLKMSLYQVEQKIKDIVDNKIYSNSFEWRFEFPEVMDKSGNFIGFDVIIGNPPYYQIQYSEFDFNKIKKEYLVYEQTGDIYSLFIEKGTNLIKNNSIISFIVSNRFCNTNYGSSTRKFMGNLDLEVLINANDVEVFDEANVGTLIFIAKKSKSDDKKNIKLKLLTSKEELNNMQETMLNTSVKASQRYFKENQWIFKENKILAIKEKMDLKGKPLINVSDLKINRGITTGANDVFIISEKVRNDLVKSDNKNSQILRPVLKGAEVKRWAISKPNNFLIYAYTGIAIEDYKEVFELLKLNEGVLKNVYEAKKKQKKWYELRKCSYYDQFEKEKLIWTRLASINSFSISTKGEFSIDSTSFATGKNLKYYCAILNSKAVLFYFKLGSVIWGKDGIKWFGDYFDNIPVPILSENEQQPLLKLVDKILSAKKQDPNSDTIALEKQIDDLVYQLYNLTEEEIKLVEDKE